MLAVCVAGARATFMKVKPVMDGFERRDVGVRLVHTGQHYDGDMSDIFFEELGVRLPTTGSMSGQGATLNRLAR